jgi:glycosyltransferase involved in cell wall biosynthesis
MMRRIIQEARAVFSDGFDLSKRIEERFGRSAFFLATTRSFKKMGPGQPGKQERLKKPGGPYRFLFVGRIEKVKGIDLLLQSMVYLKKEVPRVHLTVVGRGGIEEWAKNFIKQESLEENVSWMGNVPDETLASLYESSDCVVIPSRSESIPLVFSEALRFDKDLIVTDVGDMGTLGRQYGVAQVVPPEDIAALKESLKKKVELQAKGKKAEDGAKREELKRLFDIETSVDRFLADYK